MMIMLRPSLIVLLLFLAVPVAWSAPQATQDRDVTFLPVDEGPEVPDFVEFRNALIQAVKNEDDAFLIEHASDDISFGYKMDRVEDEAEYRGKEKFKSILKTAERNEVYLVLRENIGLGGTWGDRRWGSYGKDCFCANYVHMCWPEDRVSLRTDKDLVAVTGDKVNVRSGPGTSHDIVATISYEIVEVFGEYSRMLRDSPSDRDTIDGESYPWYPIRLSSGKQGYVFGKYISIPSRGTAILVFKKLDDMWKIVYIHLSC